jgi:sugar-specific transcriptional regulator TrmB
LALLTKGSASAGEIASISGVPRSRTYDVLESLEKKGFTIAKIGKPVKYLGVKPNVILEKLKNNVKTRAEEKIKTLGKLKDTSEFQRLEELYNEGINPIKREDISASIKGRSVITSYLNEILEEAKKEVLICMGSEELQNRESLFLELFTKLKNNGIDIKIVLTGNKILLPNVEKVVPEIKFVDMHTKFFIVDRKEVLFYLSEKSSKEEQAIWINSNFFSEGFAGLFDLLFKKV